MISHRLIFEALRLFLAVATVTSDSVAGEIAKQKARVVKAGQFLDEIGTTSLEIAQPGRPSTVIVANGGRFWGDPKAGIFQISNGKKRKIEFGSEEEQNLYLLIKDALIEPTDGAGDMMKAQARITEHAVMAILRQLQIRTSLAVQERSRRKP